MTLIISLIVLVIISVLASLLFFRVSNDNRLVRMFTDSTRAFWLAEAGIARLKTDLAAYCTAEPPDNSVSGSIIDANHQYSASCAQRGSTEYYDVVSTGTVVASSPYANTTRTINALLKTEPGDPGNFQHAIRAEGELKVGGSVTINGDQEEYASFGFEDLFGYTMAEVEAAATNHYTNPENNVTPVSGITWVDLTGNNQFVASNSGWSGTGILVVNGDADISGGTFDGILYVIGKLKMSGNPVISGTIIVESGADIDTSVTGNVVINFDSGEITSSLEGLSFMGAEFVSWEEE